MTYINYKSASYFLDKIKTKRQREKKKRRGGIKGKDGEREKRRKVRGRGGEMEMQREKGGSCLSQPAKKSSNSPPLNAFSSAGSRQQY